MTSPSHPRLRKLGRLALTLAVLLALLAIAEWGSAFWLGGRSTHYLVRGTSNGFPAWVDNPLFPCRFALPRFAGLPPPLVATQDPQDRAYRVCILTDSTPLGPAPHSADFAFPRQLEALLRARCPDIPVEVLHMTCPGANSHVLREIARDLRNLHPDAVVVLCGNDELAGPYGPVAAPAFSPAPFAFRPGPRFARPFAVFSRLRLAQAIQTLAARLAPDAADRAVWTSREPQLVPGWLRPDDPGLADAREAYSDNLDAILALASAASPTVLACTTPVNLLDCPPLATAWSPDSETSQLDREALFRAAANEGILPDEAQRLYEAILHRTPAHAEALYRSGLLALRRGHPDLAAARLSAARDADAFRMRCDSTFNLLLANAADRADVSLLDAAALFAERSGGPVPGNDLFVDPIHMTFEGHYILASAILDSLSSLGSLPEGPSADLAGEKSPVHPTLPDVSALADSMLYAPWGHLENVNAALAALYDPPLRNQPGQPAALERLKAEKARLESQAAALASVAPAIHSRRRAADSSDPFLAARAARFFFDAGDFADAASSAEVAARTWPHRPDIRALHILSGLLQIDPDTQAAAAVDQLRQTNPEINAEEEKIRELKSANSAAKRRFDSAKSASRSSEEELTRQINADLSAWALSLDSNEVERADAPWPGPLVAAVRTSHALAAEATVRFETVSNALVSASNALASAQAASDEATRKAEAASAELKASQAALDKARKTNSGDTLAATQALTDLIRKTDQLQSSELAARSSAQMVAQRLPPAQAEMDARSAEYDAAKAELFQAQRVQGGAVRDLRQAWLRERNRLIASEPGIDEERAACMTPPGLWGPTYPEDTAHRTYEANMAAQTAKEAADGVRTALDELEAVHAARRRECRKTITEAIFAETLPLLLRNGGNTPEPDDAGSLPRPTPAELDAAQTIGDTLAAHSLQPLAVPWYRFILDCNPDRPDAALALADALRQLGYPREAVDVLRSASDRLPSNPDLLEALGSHLCILLDHAGSDDAYERANRLVPFRYSRFLRRAQTFMEIRHPTRAYHSLARYLEFYPDDPAALSLRAAIEPRLPPDFFLEKKPAAAPKPSILDSLKE